MMETVPVVEMLQAEMEEVERREKATYHAWFVFLGACAIFGWNYFFEADWLLGPSVVVVAIATMRTFAETRGTLFALSGIGVVFLGVYLRGNEVGTVLPFILMGLGLRLWAQGVCVSFIKGIVPPPDPTFP